MWALFAPPDASICRKLTVYGKKKYPSSLGKFSSQQITVFLLFPHSTHSSRYIKTVLGKWEGWDSHKIRKKQMQNDPIQKQEEKLQRNVTLRTVLHLTHQWFLKIKSLGPLHEWILLAYFCIKLSRVHACVWYFKSSHQSNAGYINAASQLLAATSTAEMPVHYFINY